MAKSSDPMWLPKELDIDEILNRKRRPRCVTYDPRNKLPTLEYVIWRYINEGASVVDIGKELQCKHYATITYWLKKYGLFEKTTGRERGANDARFIRTTKFRRKAKVLHNSGIITYAAIARELKCGETIIKTIAIEDGWTHETRIPKFEWIVPKTLPDNTAETFKRYRGYIHHFTKRIVYNHFDEEELLKLMCKTHHIDHKLSIYDGWHRGKKPLPWQMLCHPANLRIITCHENLVKHRHSILNPKQLQLEILAFEQTKGKVKLPIEVFTET